MRRDNFDLIFGIKIQDIQLLSEETIGRGLDGNELKILDEKIKCEFHNWDCWLKELIFSEFQS